MPIKVDGTDSVFAGETVAHVSGLEEPLFEAPTVKNPYCRHGDIHGFCAYSPEQEIFCSSPAYEGFFGGAAGPGKTVLLLNEGVRQVDLPGYRAILFRRTFGELDQVIEMSHDTFPAHGGKYNIGKHKWTFPHYPKSASPHIKRAYQPGAIYTFAYCEKDKDKLRYQGKAFAYIAWDELTQYPNDSVYTYLFLRCRPFRQGQGIKSYIRSASNPGGPGHGWVKQRFIEDRKPYELYEEKLAMVNPMTGEKIERSYLRQYVKALLDSNDILMRSGEYETSLMAYPDPELRRAMRFGDWDIAAGMMFSELRDGIHRVPARPPLDHTRLTMCMDWGYEHYAVTGWYETTSKQYYKVAHSWKYREYVRNHTTPRVYAQSVVSQTPPDERPRIDKIVIDSSAWATPQDGGESPAELMMPVFKSVGWKMVPISKGSRSRVQGWQRLHEHFYPKRAGGPLLRIMDNCPVTWRQLTSIQRGIEPHDIEDIEPHQSDDACDETRYWAWARQRPAQPTVAEILATDVDLDKMIDPASYEAAKIEKARAAGFPAVPVGSNKRRKLKRRF